MSILVCFAIVIAFLAIGELVSTGTKAYMPSVFVTALCFMVGFWTFIPKDVVAQASFGPNYVVICMSLLLVHLGTLMSVKKLLDQWKAVLIAVVGICGTVMITMTIGRMLFDHQVVVAVTPPLTGGVVAALLMSQALTAKGLTALVAMPVAMLVLHSFAGYPITSWCLKREGVRLLSEYRKKGTDGNQHVETANPDQARKKLLPAIPEAYLSPYLIILKLMLVGIFAAWLSALTKGAVNQYIICLVLGVVLCEAGFLEEGALVKAGVFNWLMMGLLAFVFSQLNSVTPQSLAQIIVPIVVLIILGIIGMFITSSLVGRFVGYSTEMSFACALTALFGFPADYIITQEVCKSVSANEAEDNHLMGILLPRMLVGGFATVSIASVVIASIFVNLL